MVQRKRPPMTMTTHKPLTIRAHELGCDRGGVPIFRGVSFTLQSGQALILRGPNGSGKTSLLRVIAGLTPRAEGTLETSHDGKNWQTISAMGMIAYQGHEHALKAPLTTRENLRFWARLYRTAHNIDNVLERVGLAHAMGQQVGLLSAGQKRRLALARLFLQQSPLWLLDEPTASLDTAAETLTKDLLEAHLRGNGMAVIATHMPFTLDAPAHALTLAPAISQTEGIAS